MLSKNNLTILSREASPGSNLADSCAHVVVLKLGGSGSTWFADTLRGIPGVLFEHQLLAPGTNKFATAASAEAHLAQSATAPCGRHVLVGFDANPLGDEGHIPGVSFARVLRGLPGVAFITWTRTNVVLKAFSGLNFKEAKGACHVHNMNSKAMDAAVIERCRRDRHEANQTMLLDGIRKAACNRHELLSSARSLAPHNAPPHEMVYEDFARDPNAALAALFRFLRVTEKHLHARKNSTIVKRSSENISTMLSNAAVVRRWLRAWSRAAAPLEAMFDDTEYTSFEQLDSQLLCEHVRRVQVEVEANQ